MSETTVAPAQPAVTAVNGHRKPPTDAAAVHELEQELSRVRDRAAQIRQAPELHKPKLVVSDHVRASSILDKLA